MARKCFWYKIITYPTNYNVVPWLIKIQINATAITKKEIEKKEKTRAKDIRVCVLKSRDKQNRSCTAILVGNLKTFGRSRDYPIHRAKHDPHGVPLTLGKAQFLNHRPLKTSNQYQYRPFRVPWSEERRESTTSHHVHTHDQYPGGKSSLFFPFLLLLRITIRKKGKEQKIKFKERRLIKPNICTESNKEWAR